MRRSVPLPLIALLCAAIIADAATAKGPASGPVAVRSYTRRDGTVVPAHLRTAPDGNFPNNWTSYGNVNPTNGKVGTKGSPPANYGSDVLVYGYVRADGTYVGPYLRSAPDGDPSNNLGLSTRAESASAQAPARNPDPIVAAKVTLENPSNSWALNSIGLPATSEGVNIPRKVIGQSAWATDGMTSAERAEHSRLVRLLRSQGQDLVYWNLYSVDELWSIEMQVAAQQVRK